MRNTVAKRQLQIPKNISDQIYEILLERIISGDYKTGDRIDTTQLVGEFRVSRSPVKDALNKLFGAGIVDISARKGHYVRTISSQELVDLFDFRLILEVNAARRAVGRVDDKALGVLGDIIEKSLKIVEKEGNGDIVKVYHLDSQFHKTIVNLAQNKLVAETYRQIHLLSHAARTQFVETKERSIAAQMEHREILQAMVERNAAEVERAITRHLQNAERALLAEFEKLQKTE